MSSDSPSQSNRIAFLFPGQGSQCVGMAKDFYENIRASRLVFEEASDITHLNLKKICFEGPLETLTLTENLQPALFTTEAAIFAAIRSESDLRPSLCAGHSLGEYTALYAAGSLSMALGAKLTQLRGKAMQNTVPIGQGSMCAVLGLSHQQVDELCKKAQEDSGETVEPANYNAPGQVVVAGSIEGVRRVIAITKNDEKFKGTKTIPLQVSAPFHCSLMVPAQKQMQPHLVSALFKKPDCPIIANVTATTTTSELEFAPLLTSQITQAVRWDQSMCRLREYEIDFAIEVGPGKVLAGLHKRIDKEMLVKNVSTIEQFKEVIKK